MLSATTKTHCGHHKPYFCLAASELNSKVVQSNKKVTHYLWNFTILEYHMVSLVTLMSNSTWILYTYESGVFPQKRQGRQCLLKMLDEGKKISTNEYKNKTMAILHNIKNHSLF